MRRLSTLAVTTAVATVVLVVGSGVATATTTSFPSSGSHVVGSVGFLDKVQVGYFWSSSRGDLVSQFVPGPASVDQAILDVEVVTNVLNSGAEVDWNLEIDGSVVGSFVVHEGFTGPITVDVTFPAIVGRVAASGPAYSVLIRVTNEVPGGEGSHTLAYAGSYAHSIELLGP
ncbi:MAG TPA: hypothetical protein VEM93_04845 [Actinomycetota bacterium]|nr:hypothetical protein [Actinomycetota bacterium]